MGDADRIISDIVPRYKTKPAIEYNLSYDSTTETLEPIYFWILDFMEGKFSGKVEKIVDNFASSPGGGHFSELQGKASHMQQEASRVLGTVNSILKGVLNLIYDLKEFKIRLSHYEAANSSEKEKKEAGILALKQIWMDKVDILRGQGSINALASGNLQFVTLRDAFMIANSVKDIEKIDLNDRVKRILKPRVQEFFEWKERSYQELKKRFEIEKIYLKSQVQALQLNAKWAKPYLKAASQLTVNEQLAGDAALVTAFNTVMLQLSLMGYKSIDVEESVIDKELPYDFKKMKRLREYYKVVFVDLKFRGIPGKAGQHYVFGGKADVNFRAYSLNQEEMDLLKYQMKESDLEDSLRLIQGMTDDSLLQLKSDLDEFLGDDKKKSEGTPLSSLFSFFSSSKKSQSKEEKEKEELERLKKLKEKGVKKDNYAEGYIRNLAEMKAKEDCFSIYDTYKKGHGMVTMPYPGKYVGEESFHAPTSSVEKLFGFR